MNVHQSALPILIVAIPLLTSFVLPVLGWSKRAAVFPVALAALAFSFGTSIVAAREVLTNGPIQYFMGGWAPPWGIEYRIDHLAALMLLLLSFITLLVGIYSKKSILQELPEPQKEVPFYTVYLLLVSGLMGIVATADMFNLYVFLEITSLASYALISIGSGAAVVSAFRYVILGTVGAAFYLLAVAYLYSVTGSLNMADLSRLLPDLYRSNAVLVGFAFFVIGMAIKMALFPMHAWLPGAYADAPLGRERLDRRHHDQGGCVRAGAGDVLRFRTTLLGGDDPGHHTAELDGSHRHDPGIRDGDRPVGPQAHAGLFVGVPDRLHRARRGAGQRDGIDRRALAPRQPRVHEGVSLFGGRDHHLPNRVARDSASFGISPARCHGPPPRSALPRSP